MLKRILIISSLFCNVLTASSQIDTIIWQVCLGILDGENHVKAIEKTRDGYLFGIDLEKNGPGITNHHGKSDAWIVYTGNTGNIIWEKCFGGSEGDASLKIININENTFYLLNESWSIDGDVINGREGNFWIVKINSSGDILWENCYGGCIMGDQAMDAILMPDKGLLMMGRISSTGGDITAYYGDMDIWMCRIDSVGNILWEKTIGNEGADNGLKIKLTSDSTVIFIGSHEIPGGMIGCPDIGYYIYIDVWIVELDLEGTIINQWCYGGKYPDQGHDIIKVQDGYVIAAITVSDDRDVSGLHGTPGGDSYDIWVFKTDHTGNLVWQKCLGGYSSDYPKYIAESADSGIIIIGNTYSLDGDVTENHSLYDSYSDIWVVKLSSDGQLLWEHCFGGLATEKFWGIHSVLKLDDYNYVIGANSNYASHDVTCDLFPNNIIDENAWLFEIKDCSYYMPQSPVISIGPDTLCSTVNPESRYFLETVPWAMGYEWKIEPDSACVFFLDSASIHANWNPLFEGMVTVIARSYNDCGYSAWSEPHFTRVFSCTGIEETGGKGEEGKRGSWEIWPNPCREMLNVECLMLNEERDCSIVLYNIFGKEIQASYTPSISEEGGLQIDVSFLPPGVYFISVLDVGKRIAGGKFVVSR